MLMRHRFSEQAVKLANMSMMLGEKPMCHIGNKFSYKDIERAWREASMKVFGDGERND